MSTVQDAIFSLACGCDQVGWSGSTPAHQWRATGTALIYCVVTPDHGYTEIRTIVTLPDLEGAT